MKYTLLPFILVIGVNGEWKIVNKSYYAVTKSSQ